MPSCFPRPCPQVIQEGPLAGVPVRQAEAAAEKSFLLHRVRLALAHHCAAGDGFSALLGAIKRGAKAAGKTFFVAYSMGHEYSIFETISLLCCVCDKLLPKLQANGHKVVIFSQFRIMLNIIEDYMVLRGFSFDRVDGAVTGNKTNS